MSSTILHSEDLPKMKTIGILGGTSDQATAEYYRLINAGVNQRLGGWNTAEVIINSVNFGNIERFVRNDEWEAAGRYLADKARGLERAGADMLLCVSNTLHRVADVFTAGLSMQLLHIVDPTAEAIRTAGLDRVALLGTKPVMASDYIRRRYAERYAISTIIPEEDEQCEIDRIIFDELVKRELKPESKAKYLEIADRLHARGAQGLILGCTEIFLLIDQRDRPHFPMFNTTELHVEAAVRMALE